MAEKSNDTWVEARAVRPDGSYVVMRSGRDYFTVRRATEHIDLDRWYPGQGMEWEWVRVFQAAAE